MQEGLQVLVGTLLVADTPVGDGLAALVADVLVAGTGVVDADAIAAPAAQRLAHRPADRLAEQVPQRDVDRPVGPRLPPPGAAPCRTGPTARCRSPSCRAPPRRCRASRDS